MVERDRTSEHVCPYGELFIYYIEGIVTRDEKFFGGDFLGNWMEEEFSFLFFSKPSDEIMKDVLSEHPELVLLDQFEMSYDDWLGERLVPCNIGRFTISPPWDQPDTFFLPNFGAFHILLDPGVVFGTGTHPTTHDCLEMMDTAFRSDRVESVLDLGTGTGLLALAAEKFQCRKVLAVDFNYLAVKTAMRNILLNDSQDRIIAVQGLAEDFIEIPADLLIANIHYDVMKDIIEAEGFLDKKQFILSGLLSSQAGKVEEQLARLPVEIIEKRSQNGVWHTFYGKVLG